MTKPQTAYVFPAANGRNYYVAFSSREGEATARLIITGLDQKPGMKAYSHYDGEDCLLRIIDDTGEEWDEDLADWDLITDLTADRLFWRHRYDGREIDSVFNI